MLCLCALETVFADMVSTSVSARRNPRPTMPTR